MKAFFINSLAVVLFFLSLNLQAAPVISVDFEATSIITQAGFQRFGVEDAGGQVPLFNNYTVSDPSVSSGSVTVGLANGTDYTDFNNNTGSFYLIGRNRSGPTDSGAFTYGNLYRDLTIASNYNGSTNVPGTYTLQLQLTGLNASTLYGLTFYTYDNNSSGTSTIVNRTGGGSSTLGTVTYVQNAVFTANDQYSLTASALSDASGNLLFSFTNTGTNNQAILNGFELTAIPEPSTFALVGMGLLSLLALRRRAAKTG